MAMPAFHFPAASRALAGSFCLSLLLTACASSSKSARDMRESQRIRAANGGNLEAISLLQTVNYYDKDRNQHYRSKEDQLKWIRKDAELGDGARNTDWPFFHCMPMKRLCRWLAIRPKHYVLHKALPTS